jgi:outer membrane murein-binding lipoprotein Lpp
LQNNLQFFSSSSNENPVVVEVTSKIEKLSAQKEALEEKSNAIKSLKRELKKQQEAEEVNEETDTQEE